MKPAEYCDAKFGDKRLSKRYEKIVETVMEKPDKSFPKQSSAWSELKGLYRFFANGKVDHPAIIAPHCEQTVRRCGEQPRIVLVEDTTFLNYSDHPHTEDLGAIGTEQIPVYGMLVHSVYAVSPQEKKPLGLIAQRTMVRTTPIPRRETRQQRRQRTRESEKWIRGARDGCALLAAHPHAIHVCDREADIYEFLCSLGDLNQWFVVRCSWNRATIQGHVFTDIIHAVNQGTTTIPVARNGKRPARIASVKISSCAVQIKPPRILNRKGPLLSVNLVVIEETDVPPKTTPLFWVLLTNEPVDTFEQCLFVMHCYQARWLIEEFHKGLKTGCSIEHRQLQTRSQLEKLLGMFSVIVYQMLLLRFQAAHPEQPPPDLPLSDTQIAILSHRFPHYPGNPSPTTLLLMVARLGGFIGRKSDGNPGWLTIMRGMYDLVLLEQGVLLAQQLVGKG